MAHTGRYLAFSATLALSWASGFGAAQSRFPVELKFSVFAERLPSEIKYLPKPNEPPIELRFYSAARSRIYEYEGSNPLVFFHEVELPPDPQRPTAPRIQRVTVGYADVAPGMHEALILFSAEGTWSANTIPIYRVQAFDDSMAAFPPEHIAFLNATGQMLFGSVDRQRLEVPSGLSAPVAIRPGETPVALSALINGRAVPVYKETLALGPQQRLTVVLFPPYREDVVQVQRRLLYDPNRRPKIERPSEGGG